MAGRETKSMAGRETVVFRTSSGMTLNFRGLGATSRLDHRLLA